MTNGSKIEIPAPSWKVESMVLVRNVRRGGVWEPGVVVALSWICGIKAPSMGEWEYRVRLVRRVEGKVVMVDVGEEGLKGR